MSVNFARCNFPMRILDLLCSEFILHNANTQFDMIYINVILFALCLFLVVLKLITTIRQIYEKNSAQRVGSIEIRLLTCSIHVSTRMSMNGLCVSVFFPCRQH